MKIMFSVGEVSGDLHGSYLVRTLKKYNPNIYFFGLGGSRMREEGVEIIDDVTEYSTIGFVEPLPYIPKFLFLLKRLERILREEKPDLLILIDFQGFNVLLAKIAKKLDIPTIYYFAPQYWLWGNKDKVKEIAEHITWIIATFPQEYSLYKNYTDNIVYFGHPLVDYLSGLERREREENLIGLFPGSRKHEIKSLMPLFMNIADHFSKQGFKFILPISSDKFKPLIEKFMDKNIDIEVISGKQSYSALQRISLGLASSGTITLEATLLLSPLFVFYKTSFITYMIAKRLVHHKYISLPNILAGKEIYPEYIQKFNIKKIVTDVEEFLKNPNKRENMIRELGEIRSTLGEEGVLDKIAKFIISRAYE